MDKNAKLPMALKIIEDADLLPLILFGADPDTPKEAFIICLGVPTTRWIPYKFTTFDKLFRFHQERSENYIFVKIPGFNILLAAQRFNFSNSQFYAAQKSYISGAQIIKQSDLVVDFYLTKKIQPNAAKFQRYEYKPIPNARRGITGDL